MYFLSLAFMVLVKQLRQTSDPSGLISSLGFTFISNFDYEGLFITLFISLLLDLHYYLICKVSLNVT